MRRKQRRAAIKVFVTFGTRPEAIKMAPVILELAGVGDKVDPVVCVTGQHREMLDQVLNLFGINPNIDLELMEPNQRLDELTGKALRELSRVIEKSTPDVVLVQGDATSAMAGALAAFYQKVLVGHIEAGLRTGDLYAPFPEEVNRRIITTVAGLHFAPVKRAADALISEGVPSHSIHIVGNTVIDALLAVRSRLTETDRDKFKLDGRKLILLTSHRRETFGEPLRRVCRAAAKLAARNKDIEILYPMHLNPNVRRVAVETLSGLDRVHLCEPLAYKEMVAAMSECYLILTDSGGIQEEAPILGKPVLVLRERTERVEAVEAGVSKLVGTDADTIVREVETLLRRKGDYLRMARRAAIYGDGQASKRIVKILLGDTAEEFSPDTEGLPSADV
jgi:UDP-N-acetylglucosamine 2-epimerase